MMLVGRRKQQMADSGGSEKDAVADYFNTQGFERWKKIYGTTEDVNKVNYAVHSCNGRQWVWDGMATMVTILQSYNGNAMVVTFP